MAPASNPFITALLLSQIMPCSMGQGKAWHVYITHPAGADCVSSQPWHLLDGAGQAMFMFITPAGAMTVC